MPKVVLKLDDDVSTDMIYPGRYMATVLPSETPRYAFEDDVDFNKKLNNKEIPKGSIIVAGKNFGCGSSREQAVSCLKGYELTIIAKGFARIFSQNSVNLGLSIITVPDISTFLGDEIEITESKIINKTTNKIYDIIPLSPMRRAVIDAGGLIPYTRKMLLKNG